MFEFGDVLVITLSVLATVSKPPFSFILFSDSESAAGALFLKKIFVRWKQRRDNIKIQR